MLKFAGNTKGTNRPVLGIGLSRENCSRLLEGQPIEFSTDGMGLPDLTVFLMAGESESTMTTQLLEMGAFSVEDIREDRSLADPHNIHPVDTKGAN